jgi:alkanesulfonate monooxygenase SsuD/methylene tetrahydromethanopterin reductase-like flavin-dependent oxidoreductase (luciferase family)
MQHWPAARRAWQDAEAVGLDVAYTADHLTHPSMPGAWWSDGFTTLGAAAAVTSRIEIGPLVAAAGIRNPATLARAAATVHDISDGRLVLGLGAGTPGDVAADRGVTPSAAESSGRFAEVVAGVRAIWAGESVLDGEHVSARGLLFAPLPPRLPAPHLLLAAHGARGMDLVARHADGWSTYGGPAAGQLGGDELWSALGEQAARLDDACAAAGRDPRQLRRSVLLGFGPDRPLESVDAYVDTVGRAESLGFTEVVVYWPVGDPGTRFWSEPDVLAAGVAQARA